MSTNSAIGVVINGKIKAVYCHWDGYVDGVGKMLFKHYDQKKTEVLVSKGSVSSLQRDIGVKHPFSTYTLSDADRAKYENMTTFYRRDRGETDVSAKVFDTAEDFLKYFGAEFWYLLGTDGVWYFSEGDMDWKPVAKHIQK